MDQRIGQTVGPGGFSLEAMKQFLTLGQLQDVSKNLVNFWSKPGCGLRSKPIPIPWGTYSDPSPFGSAPWDSRLPGGAKS